MDNYFKKGFEKSAEETSEIPEVSKENIDKSKDVGKLLASIAGAGAGYYLLARSKATLPIIKGIGKILPDKVRSVLPIVSTMAFPTIGAGLGAYGANRLAGGSKEDALRVAKYAPAGLLAASVARGMTGPERSGAPLLDAAAGFMRTPFFEPAIAAAGAGAGVVASELLKKNKETVKEAFVVGFEKRL